MIAPGGFAEGGVDVYFCGTRGSMPAPGEPYVRYGGHTSCVGLARGRETVGGAKHSECNAGGSSLPAGVDNGSQPGWRCTLVTCGSLSGCGPARLIQVSAASTPVPWSCA
jgi:hypothetical protein